MMDQADATRDPEILVYFARHYAHCQRTEKAFDALRRAAQAGFICAPKTLRVDPWFSSLRKHRQSASLLQEFETIIHQVQSRNSFR